MHTRSVDNKSMRLTAAISMGVGAMVGAGIFALMGEAGSRAGNAVYISFIIAALLSAASSINANLYSTANMTYLLAKYGELPEFEARKLWRAGTGGLLTTAVLILLIANFLDLGRIASLGSIVYLIVYSAVHWGHLKSLLADTGASKLVVSLAFLTNAAVLVIFGFQAALKNSLVICLLIALLSVAFLTEMYMQKVRNRTITSQIRKNRTSNKRLQ